MYKFVFLWILVVGLTAACGNSKETASNSENAEDSVKVEAPPVDGEGQLSPGHARIAVELHSDGQERSSGEIVWETTVHKVYGYGSSTPLIDAGKPLRIDATAYMNGLKGELDLNEQKKKRLICIVSRRAPTVGEQNTDAPRWKLEQILEKE